MGREEFFLVANARGVANDCAEWFWNTFDARNWIDKEGQPVSKPISLLMNTWVTWQANAAKQRAQWNNPTNQPKVKTNPTKFVTGKMDISKL